MTELRVLWRLKKYALLCEDQKTLHLLVVLGEGMQSNTT